MAQVAPLVAQMSAAVANLQAQLTAAAPTSDQIAAEIHSIVDGPIAALNAAQAKFDTSEAQDEDDVAELQAAIGVVIKAFTPGTAEVSGTPAPSPAPDSAAA